MSFNLLLQLLRIETFCSSEASLRGCLDEILCLPLKTRVKSCPHCQKQSLPVISVICLDIPAVLVTCWIISSAISSFLRKSSISNFIAEFLETREWTFSDSSEFCCFISSLLLLKQTKKIKRHHYMYSGSADVHVINLWSSSSEQLESQKCHI